MAVQGGMDDLSIEQRRALQQLREITDGDDNDFAIGVLSSVDWDVQVCLAQYQNPCVLTVRQRAAELFFESATVSRPPPPAPPMEIFDIDDSAPARQRVCSLCLLSSLL